MMRLSPSMARATRFDHPIEQRWVMVDAAGRSLGRVASVAAGLLMGKHKPAYSHDKNCGDHVVIVNAGKLVLTGNKLKQKKLFQHTGYLGGVKLVPYRELFPDRVDVILHHAVNNMLPKNRLRTRTLRRLKVFKDATHTLPVKNMEAYTW